ncbi:MAG: hypothetical protein ABI461_11530 [Polyangiaceae bacterium]
MHRAWMVLLGGAALAYGACATSTTPGSPSGVDEDAGDIPVYDAGGQPTGNDGGTSTACTLGTADHCGTCATACPSIDNAGTKRVCSDGTSTATCDIVCLGELYDMNGTTDDGCEAEDPVVHDSAEAGVAEVATTAGFTVGAPDWFVYGDTRKHDVAPVDRPLGREDWYTLSNPHGRLKVCLTIANFPADNQFEVCVTNLGNKNIEVSQCKTITPTSGSNDCVQPAASTNGTYWARVRKLAGSNSLNGYALFVQD